MLLWRLLLLPFFVQFEIRVELEANASHGAVRGREDVAVQSASDATRVSDFSVDLWRLFVFVAVQSASDATRVSAFSVDLWRLLLLPFFVQLEIRVGL